MLPFSIDDLEREIQAGTVTRRMHPTLPLNIYNYAPSVQYTNYWNDVTLNCRGLILDEDYNIVARPWKKFFNLGQVNLPIQMTDPVEVMDKADGSLGIMYPADGGWAIATRGSFESEQAIHGTDILVRNYRQDFSNFDCVDDYTFLFEIVYPRNRIVLNYGDMDDLILLGAVEKARGHYVSPIVAQAMLGWNGPVVKVFEYSSISEALGHMDRDNAEGYVIRSHNFMVKLKQPDYLELHRLVTNVTPKNIWEQLKAGNNLGDILSLFPDEFHDLIRSIAQPILDAFDTRLQEILSNYSDVMDRVPPNANRKAIAEKFKRHRDSKYYFLLLDGRPIRELLWNELKPKESALDVVGE